MLQPRWRIYSCLFLLIFTSCSKPRGEHAIVIGCKNFTEQVVLGEILAQHIESRTSLEVERRFNLGGTLIAQQAITSGAIDAYVEYTGTALAAVLNEPLARSREEVFQRVKVGYKSRFGLEVLEPLGFENNFAIVVRGEDARRLNLRTVSDLRPHIREWRPGFGYEFMERPDGYAGFTAKYQLHFEIPPRTLELGLLYRALMEKLVDIVAGSSTDGPLGTLDVVVLEDDQHYFPPYEAVPIVRPQAFEMHPGLREALQELAGRFSEDEMRRLNYEVDGEAKDVKVVVREFLQQEKL
jgi:glycine betaine/choline ABC-type transport system substrate-binding protein